MAAFLDIYFLLCLVNIDTENGCQTGGPVTYRDVKKKAGQYSSGNHPMDLQVASGRLRWMTGIGPLRFGTFQRTGQRLLGGALAARIHKEDEWGTNWIYFFKEMLKAKGASMHAWKSMERREAMEDLCATALFEALEHFLFYVEFFYCESRLL